MTTDSSALWRRVREGLPTAVFGRLPEPPPELHLLRVSCDVAPAELRPLIEARRRAEAILDEAQPVLDQARERVVSRLRRRLLGEAPERATEAVLVEVWNNLAKQTGHAWALIFEAVEAADASTLATLTQIVRRPGWLQLPLVLVLRAEPEGGAAALLATLQASAGADAVFRGEEPVAAPAAAYEWRSLPPPVLRVLRAGSLVGPGFEAEVVASLLGEQPVSVLERLQEAADLGVPVEDRGEGRFSLPAPTLLSLARSVLPSLAQAWHRRLGRLLSARGSEADEAEREVMSPETCAAGPGGLSASEEEAAPAAGAEAPEPPERVEGGEHAGAEGEDRSKETGPLWGAPEAVFATKPVAESIEAAADWSGRPGAEIGAGGAREGIASGEPGLATAEAGASGASEGLAGAEPRRAAVGRGEAAGGASEGLAGAEPRRAAVGRGEEADASGASEGLAGAEPRRAAGERGEEVGARGASEGLAPGDETSGWPARAEEGPAGSSEVNAAALAEALAAASEQARVDASEGLEEALAEQARLDRSWPAVEASAADASGLAPEPAQAEVHAGEATGPIRGGGRAGEAGGRTRTDGRAGEASERSEAAARSVFPDMSLRAGTGRRGPREEGEGRPAGSDMSSRPGPAGRGDPLIDAIRAAEHLRMAGELDAAAERYVAAARAADEAGAPQTAAQHARRALALLSTLPSSPGRRRLRVRALMELGRLQWQSAGPELGSTLTQALATLEHARQELGQGDPVSLFAELCQLIAGVCFDLGDLRSLERALEELSAASRALHAAGDATGAARLLNDQAAVYVRMGDPVRALHLLRESRRVFEAGSETDPVVLRELAETDRLFARIPLHAQLRPGREQDGFSMGLDHALAAERAYRRLGDTRELARVWETMGRLELRKGRSERAVQRLQAALEVQMQIGDLTGLARTTEALSEVLAASGRDAEALTLLRDSVLFNREKGSPLGLALGRRAFEALYPRLAARSDLGPALRELAELIDVAEGELGTLRLPGEGDA